MNPSTEVYDGNANLAKPLHVAGACHSANGAAAVVVDVLDNLGKRYPQRLFETLRGLVESTNKLQNRSGVIVASTIDLSERYSHAVRMLKVRLGTL
jgi:hypothetical protein